MLLCLHAEAKIHSQSAENCTRIRLQIKMSAREFPPHKPRGSLRAPSLQEFRSDARICGAAVGSDRDRKRLARLVNILAIHPRIGAQRWEGHLQRIRVFENRARKRTQTAQFFDQLLVAEFGLVQWSDAELRCSRAGHNQDFRLRRAGASERTRELKRDPRSHAVAEERVMPVQQRPYRARERFHQFPHVLKSGFAGARLSAW